MQLHELEDLEKIITLEYAKKTNIWINDFYSLGNRILVGGNEHTLILNSQKKLVYKSNNLINSRNLITNVFEKVEIHNTLFPETQYVIIGFTGIDNGISRTPHIEVILKQIYIPNLNKSEPFEIKLFMEKLGFKQTTPESYVNNDYLVFDLFPRNVLKDNNGNLYVVDAEFRDISNLKKEVKERILEEKRINFELKKVMNSVYESKSIEPIYQTIEHRRNSENVVKYIHSIDYSQIDWDKEAERQKINARD